MPGALDLETLPCGCKVGTAIINGANTFIIEPCSLTCKYYLFAVEESNKQGNTTEFTSREQLKRRDIQPGGPDEH